MRGKTEMIYGGESQVAWLILGGMAAFYGLAYCAVRYLGYREKRKIRQMNIRGIMVWYCPLCELSFDQEAITCPTPGCGCRTEIYHFFSIAALERFKLDPEKEQRRCNLDKQYGLVSSNRRQTTQELLEEKRRLELIKQRYLDGELSEWN